MKMTKTNIGMTETEFHDLLESWGHTLLLYEKDLYSLYKNKTYELSVTFPIRLGEVGTMEIKCTKFVDDKNNDVFIIK